MIRFIAALLVVLMYAAPAMAVRIICASTTSTQNSGLFERILPLFKADTGIDVHVIAIGTGAALETGKRGDADVVLVHARDLELQMVGEGHFVNRHDVMYNDFVILGPRGASAEFGALGKVDVVLRRISDRGLTFVSRGDNSGTHMREMVLWKSAGIAPGGNPWYVEVGQGMAKTIRIAAERRGYTLSDRGTWLSLRDQEQLQMEIAFEGDPPLFNQYGVMAVNPARHRHVKYEEAMKFIRWLISERGQRAIAEYRDAAGNPLFIPNAGR